MSNLLNFCQKKNKNIIFPLSQLSNEEVIERANQLIDLMKHQTVVSEDFIKAHQIIFEMTSRLKKNVQFEIIL